MAARSLFLRGPRTHTPEHAPLSNVQNGKIERETQQADEKLEAIGEMAKGQLGLVFASSTRLLPGDARATRNLKAAILFSLFLSYIRSAFLQPHTLTHTHPYTQNSSPSLTINGDGHFSPILCRLICLEGSFHFNNTRILSVCWYLGFRGLKFEPNGLNNISSIFFNSESIVNLFFWRLKMPSDLFLLIISFLSFN